MRAADIHPSAAEPVAGGDAGVPPWAGLQCVLLTGDEVKEFLWTDALVRSFFPVTGNGTLLLGAAVLDAELKCMRRIGAADGLARVVLEDGRSVMPRELYTPWPSKATEATDPLAGLSEAQLASLEAEYRGFLRAVQRPWTVRVQDLAVVCTGLAHLFKCRQAAAAFYDHVQQRGDSPCCPVLLDTTMRALQPPGPEPDAETVKAVREWVASRV